MSPKPPRVPELLLQCLTPRGEREFLLGDLLERYADLLAARGRAIAAAWYWAQALKTLASLPRLWRAQGREPPRRSPSPTRRPIRHMTSIVLFNLRVAVRTLGRAPVFSVGVILTLALGIGANATMFGILDRILLTPPRHLSDPDQIYRVYRLYRQSSSGTFALAQDRSYEDFVALKQAGSLSMVAGYVPTMMTVGSGLEAERVRGVMASPEFFPLLGVHPRLGRFFGAEEDQEEASLTAVLGYGYWQRRFGGDPSVLGRTLTYLGATVTVIGVAPEGFTGVDLSPVDIWLPIQPAYALLAGSSTAWRT